MPRFSKEGRQRRSEIVTLLKTDLYERVPELDPDVMTWESPLRWRVRIFGEGEVPMVEVVRGDGTVFCEAMPMTADTLDGLLP